MHNIIFIADCNFYKNANSKVNYDFVNYIKDNNKKYNITLFYTDENLEFVKNEIKRLSPKLIIFFDIGNAQPSTRLFDFVFDMNIRTAIFLDDVYYINTFTKTCPFVQKVDSIIFWYNNDKVQRSYERNFPGKYITHMRSRFLNTNRFFNYGAEKKYDILLYGTRTFHFNYKAQDLDSIQDWCKEYEKRTNTIIDREINFYPLRKKLEDILIKNSNRYNCLILPEKSLGNSVYGNEKLSQLINESYLVVCCCSIADVLFHKYLEVCGSFSLILGNYPTDYASLFHNNIVEVNEYMSEEEILNIIDKALGNKDELGEKARRLYHAINTEHNLNKATENMTEIIDNIIIKCPK